MKLLQKTIKREVSIKGIGVHSGEPSTITLKPSRENSGITIKNTHFPQEPISIGEIIPEQTMHATVIKGKSWGVSTIEHIMAAISGLDLDNISIEIEGFEAPIIDGSSLPFVHLIEQAEVLEQKESKKFLKPKNEIVIEDENKSIKITPNNSLTFSYEYSIDFNHPLVKNNTIAGNLNPEEFKNNIAPARTFGFLSQLPFLRQHGLAKGTNLGNTVVIGEEFFLNNCRFEDEFIRHKLLDLIGDLSLLGKKLSAKVVAHKTGHNFNRKVIEHYIKNPSEWEEFSI